MCKYSLCIGSCLFKKDVQGDREVLKQHIGMPFCSHFECTQITIYILPYDYKWQSIISLAEEKNPSEHQLILNIN